MASWDLCELNQLAERFKCQCWKHGKGWDCGLEQSREELGWGKPVRPCLLAAASREMLSAGC